MIATMMKRGLMIFFTFLGLIYSGKAQYFVTGVALAEETKSEKASGPYFGQTPPGSTPKRFASSKIPLGAWAITFSPDGLESFISLSENNKAMLKTSKDSIGTWTSLKTASFSGAYWDMESHITPDGSRMYFGSKRPLNGAPSGVLYQWYVDKTAIGWSEPRPMDPPLQGIFMMFPSVAENKNLYFTGGDGSTTSYIAMSKYINGNYQSPEMLDDSINYLYWSAHPFIAPDESYIIFDACTDQVNLVYELFISFRKPDNSWTKARKLPSNINPGGVPFVSRDGKYFFFWKSTCTMWVDAGFIEQMRPRYGDWLGEIPPDTIPRIFARDFISSTGNQVYSGTFSPDGKEFFYSNLTTSSNGIWTTRQINNVWTKPALATFHQSLWTIEPNFSPDGNTLLFVSDMNESNPGPPYNPALRIWCMHKAGTDWSDPMLLQGPFSDYHKMYPTIAANGNLYFTEVIGDTSFIYKSEWFSGGGYQTPVKLDNSINKFFTQAHPFIAPDESFLIFDASVDGPPEWKTNLYISFRNPDGTWKEAIKLPDLINSTGSEYCAFISSDRKYLFFSRNNETGGSNLWWVKTDQFLKPLAIEEIGYGNADPVLKQNFPNPCKDETTIEFGINRAGLVNIVLLNSLGTVVKTILNGYKEPGLYQMKIGVDRLNAGLYFCRLTAGDVKSAIKVLIE